MRILKNFSVILVALTFVVSGCSNKSSGPGLLDSKDLATVGAAVLQVDSPSSGVEPAFVLTEADSGQTFVVHSGTVFQVQLDACWTCGCGWTFEVPVECPPLKQIGYEYWYDDPYLPGGPVHESWTYRAFSKGVANISMVYWRAWEPDIIIDRVEYTIVVE